MPNNASDRVPTPVTRPAFAISSASRVRMRGPPRTSGRSCTRISSGPSTRNSGCACSSIPTSLRRSHTATGYASIRTNPAVDGSSTGCRRALRGWPVPTIRLVTEGRAVMARGTDVHPFYQRGLRWDQAGDLAFAWVKVSDGGAAYTQTQGGVVYRPDTHVAGAKSSGIPVGGYHYAQLNPGPEKQADVLLGEVRRLGATGVVPMLDLEAPFSPNDTARNFRIAFCRRVAAAGFRPAVYMSASFATAVRPDQWDVPGLVIV